MTIHKPPATAKKLLLLFLKREIAEEVVGDLDEQFGKLAGARSLSRARFNYWYQVINYIRPFDQEFEFQESKSFQYV